MAHNIAYLGVHGEAYPNPAWWFMCEPVILVQQTVSVNKYMSNPYLNRSRDTTAVIIIHFRLASYKTASKLLAMQGPKVGSRFLERVSLNAE